MQPYDYWDSPTAIHREILLWTGAAMDQLHSWESDLAIEFVRSWKKEAADGRLHWRMQIHRHLLFVVLNHLLTALDMATGRGTYHVQIAPIVSAEIRETRDLLEHWKENSAIFNTQPRPGYPKHSSGQKWADRNPEPARPNSVVSWNNRDGPRLTPNITSADVWNVLNTIATDFTNAEAGPLKDYIPVSPERAWIEVDTSRGYEWWPRIQVYGQEHPSTPEPK